MLDYSFIFITFQRSPGKRLANVFSILHYGQCLLFNLEYFPPLRFKMSFSLLIFMFCGRISFILAILSQHVQYSWLQSSFSPVVFDRKIRLCFKCFSDKIYTHTCTYIYLSLRSNRIWIITCHSPWTQSWAVRIVSGNFGPPGFCNISPWEKR